MKFVPLLDLSLCGNPLGCCVTTTVPLGAAWYPLSGHQAEDTSSLGEFPKSGLKRLCGKSLGCCATITVPL